MPQIRLGKTRKDHASGSHGRRYKNRATRNEWCNDSERTQANFPYEVCNGKRFPTRRTGKGGQTEYRKYKGATR